MNHTIANIIQSIKIFKDNQTQLKKIVDETLQPTHNTIQSYFKNNTKITNSSVGTYKG